MTNTTDTPLKGSSFEAWQKHAVSKGRLQGLLAGAVFGLIAGVLLPLMSWASQIPFKVRPFGRIFVVQ